MPTPGPMHQLSPRGLILPILQLFDSQHVIVLRPTSKLLDQSRLVRSIPNTTDHKPSVIRCSILLTGHDLHFRHPRQFLPDPLHGQLTRAASRAFDQDPAILGDHRGKTEHESANPLHSLNSDQS